MAYRISKNSNTAKNEEYMKNKEDIRNPKKADNTSKTVGSENARKTLDAEMAQDSSKKTFEKKLVYVLLAVVFFLTLSIRLYYAFSTLEFSNSGSYFILRQIEEIRNTGTPLFDDGLSYGGRYYLFLPVFHYILAFFSSFMSVTAACKLIPNIFASSAVFGIFLIVKQITRNQRIALFSAFVSGFIPVFISETVNSISVYSLTIPLTLFLMYFFLRINIRKNPNYFIIFFFVFILLDFSACILIIAIMLYLVLSWIEGLNVGRAEIELSLFSIFIMTFIYIVLFREAFLLHGHKIIWNNIPAPLLSRYFFDVNIIQAIYMIGVIPAVTGVVVVLVHLFRKKKSVYLPISFGIVLALMLALKLVPLRLGMMLLSLVFVILFGEMFSIIIEYVKRTRFSRWRPVLYALLLILFIFSSVIPSLSYAKSAISNVVEEEEIIAFDLLENITDIDNTIISSVYDGHLVTFFSKRKNIIDSNFLMAPDAGERLTDLRTIYTSAISSKPIEIMDKYGADYILFNKEAMEFYNISKIVYLNDDCFPLLYSGKNVKVYEKKCSIS